MTTATTSTAGRPTRVQGRRVLVAGLVSAVVAGLLLTLVAALVGGQHAAYGALVGVGIALLFFAFGTLAVDLVSGVMPALSLVVALLTYTCQMVLVVLVFWRLSTSEAVADALDVRWLAGGLVVVTVAWTVAQIQALRQARIPAYDLAGPSGQQAGER